MFPGAHNTTVRGSTVIQVWGNQTNTTIHNYHINNAPRGIVRNEDKGPLYYLPLEQAHIDVLIVDVSARISLSETFANASEFAMGHAKYVFPVPARAAVCAFEMQFADGRVITGVSKEKAQAAKEHKDAMRAGKATGLMDWVTDDMFIISVGSIPAKETVTTNLVFVMDLMDDELKDEVRLQLPMSVGSRYGPAPAALATANLVSSQTPLSITVDIQMSGVIRRVTSPTHPNIIVAPYLEAGHTSRLRQTVTFHSQTFLTQSFVLTVHADGLDAPRCFAERDPGCSGTVAMQLTFIPNFKLPPISAQEYLFLVDRSGSMAGPSIQIVKQALLMLLRMLPEEQTMFNIFSFGDEVDGLWRKSQPYHQSCVDIGTTHINGMTANYGGTELCAALEFVFRNRSSQISTMVFLLTDGMIYSGDKVVSAVADAVARSHHDAPLRVFALGIGHEVSSAVVESIARVGNGESLFAVEREGIENKCAKLLRAGRFPCVKNVSIDWGIPERSHSTADTPLSANLPDSVHVQLAPPPTVRQSPNRIQKIFSGMRFAVFSLTTWNAIPKQVILQGNVNGGIGQIVVVVPVSTVKAFSTKRPDIPLIHTLSAGHLITDLVERRATLPVAINPAPAEDIRKAAIVQLCVKYQLASRYTSFVAVDEETSVLHRPSPDSQSITNHPGPADKRKIMEILKLKGNRKTTIWPHEAESNTSSSSGSPSSIPLDGEQEFNFVSTIRRHSSKHSAPPADNVTRLNSSPPQSGQNAKMNITVLSTENKSRQASEDAKAARFQNRYSRSLNPTSSYGYVRRRKEIASIMSRSVATSANPIAFIPSRTFQDWKDTRKDGFGQQQPPDVVNAASASGQRSFPYRPRKLWSNAVSVATLLKGKLARGLKGRESNMAPHNVAGSSSGRASKDPSHSAPPSVKPQPVSRQVVDLVRLQNVNGSFSLSKSLGQIIGKFALEKPANVQADNVAWATALAVAFLLVHLGDSHSDVLDGILDKVSEFIEKRFSTTTFDALVQSAMANLFRTEAPKTKTFDALVQRAMANLFRVDTEKSKRVVDPDVMVQQLVAL